MKKLLLLFLLVLPFSGWQATLYGQAVPSSCDGPDSMKTYYEDDALRISLEHLDNTSSPYYDSIPIPETLSDTVLGCLLAVYNATTLPASDSVCRFMNIHQFPTYHLQSLIFQADSTVDWVRRLIHDSSTNIAVIDTLIYRYALDITSIRHITGGSVLVTMTSPYKQNMEAMASRFAAQTGVTYAHHVAQYGDGNYIEYESFPAYKVLTYSWGWGDCFVGCTSRRYWQFRVYSDCSVAYDSSYGDPLPITPVYPVVEEDVRAYPNPFYDELYVDGLEGSVDYVLFDTEGRKLREGTIEAGSVIPLNGLPQGSYLLTIRESNGKKYTLPVQRR